MDLACFHSSNLGLLHLSSWLASHLRPWCHLEVLSVWQGYVSKGHWWWCISECPPRYQTGLCPWSSAGSQAPCTWSTIFVDLYQIRTPVWWESPWCHRCVPVCLWRKSTVYDLWLIQQRQPGLNLPKSWRRRWRVFWWEHFRDSIVPSPRFP